jgi:hypothetical protein
MGIYKQTSSHQFLPNSLAEIVAKEQVLSRLHTPMVEQTVRIAHITPANHLLLGNEGILANQPTNKGMFRSGCRKPN